MMTLQGMADHRFTSVSLSTNVFLGEIIKKNWKLAYLRPSLPFYDMKNIQHICKGLAAGCHSKKCESRENHASMSSSIYI